jgi:hypothetical protein
MHIMSYCKNISINLAKAWGIVVLIFVAIIGLFTVYPYLIPQLNHIISQYGLIFTIFRWGILCTIYGLWPIFVRRIGKREYWRPEQIEYWIKQRAKVMTWLILFELIVDEKLFLTIINYWKS